MAPPRSTRASFGICQKAEAPIVSNASGSVSDVRAAPSKACLPTRRSVSGKVTELTCAPRNARSSTSVVPETTS